MARKRRNPEPRRPETVTRTYYRKDGRLVKKGTKGARRETFEYRVTRSGKLAEAIRIQSSHRILKTTHRGSVEQSGGLIFDALGKENVITTASRAKTATITIKGKDRRGKAHRFKAVIDLERIPAKRRGTGIVGKVLQVLHARGFRTEYPMSVIPTKRRESISKIKRRKELTNVEIAVDLSW